VEGGQDLDRLFPEALIRLNESHETRARLLHPESVLEDWKSVREWFRGEEADEAESYKSLKAQRGELLDRVWGVKTRCAPEKSVICRQDAIFGTQHA
jgi:hypothetical protein